MKTLSAIVNSHSDNLLTRAADVMLKEGRRLVLMPRESPLHLGHTELLTRAARLGAIVAPPVPAFYNAPSTVDDIINHSVGRALDLFGIDAGIVKRWAGPQDPNRRLTGHGRARSTEWARDLFGCPPIAAVAPRPGGSGARGSH